MSIELYVVFAVILIGWYVINADSDKKTKTEIEEIKTPEEILEETKAMYEESSKRICEMFEKSKKEISNIYKDFTKETKSYTKKSNQGVKANVK